MADDHVIRVACRKHDWTNALFEGTKTPDYLTQLFLVGKIIRLLELVEFFV